MNRAGLGPRQKEEKRRCRNPKGASPKNELPVFYTLLCQRAPVSSKEIVTSSIVHSLFLFSSFFHWLSRHRHLTPHCPSLPTPSYHSETTATMASYMTGSEAYTRESQPSVNSSAPQTAWADKYRGVSPVSPTPPNPTHYLAIIGNCRRPRPSTSSISLTQRSNFRRPYDRLRTRLHSPHRHLRY